MSIAFFTQKHVTHLATQVEKNLRHYTHAAKPWADRPAGCLTKVSDLAPAVPLDFDTQTSPLGPQDCINAVLLHRAFPTMTRAMASDPRLWTRLCHVECWAYMRKRWDVRAFQERQQQKYPDKPQKVPTYIREHYFVAGPRPSRALTRNGMARLWWYAHLTHDPARADDPYRLTRELLSHLDTTASVLERNFGRAPDVLHGFLQYLIDAGAGLGEGNDRRDHIRHLAKWLNRRGGLSLLDTFDTVRVAELLNEVSERYNSAR